MAYKLNKTQEGGLFKKKVIYITGFKPGMPEGPVLTNGQTKPRLPR